MKKLMLIILILLTNISSLQAEVKKNIFLSSADYQSLNSKNKIYYFKGLQKEFFELEKTSNTGAIFVSNDIHQAPLSTLFFSLAFADDSTPAKTDVCIIGGQSVPRIQNKCSTRKNPCKDSDSEKYPDGSFQCGEIFNAACISRTPIKSLSARCFEASQNSQTQPTTEEYEKIVSRANELYQKVCGLESPHPDSIGCKKFSKKIDELNAKAKSTNSENKAPSADPSPVSDKASTSSENTDDCKQLISLTLEGSEQNQNNSPIRENDLHQEATGFVDSLNKFYSTNYWIEPTDQPAKQNCQTKNNDQLVSITSPEYIKDITDQIKKYSTEGSSCNDSTLQEKIKNYFLNSSSTQKTEANLVYQNSQTRLLPNDSEKTCLPNIAGSSFVRIPSSQSSSLSDLAGPFIKKVQELSKQCTQIKPSIHISVFAHSGNTKQDDCNIRFMNKNITAEEFYNSIYKPVRQSNLPVTLNLNQYSTCFQEKIVSLEANEKNQKALTSPSCLLVLSSPEEPGYGINALFGPSPTIKYEQFLGKLQNPLTARICAMAINALENPKNPLFHEYETIVDSLSSKIKFPGKESLSKTCQTAYEKIKKESNKVTHQEQPFLNPKEKLLALDCLKKLNSKKDSATASANTQTIFGLLPRIEQFATTQKPYSYLQLQTISQNIPNDCNQDLSAYKKNMFVMKNPSSQPIPSSLPPKNDSKQ